MMSHCTVAAVQVRYRIDGKDPKKGGQVVREEIHRPVSADSGGTGAEGRGGRIWKRVGQVKGDGGGGWGGRA